jgi:hypothetical protein
MQALPPVNPGVYPGGGQASLLRANEQQYLFRQQLVTAGQSSIAIQLERIRGEYYPFAVSFQVWFTDVNQNPITPGAFEIDAQTSDVDADVQYATVNGLSGIASLNSNFAGRIELVSSWAKFTRVNVKTWPNVGVFVNVLATR